MIKHIDLFSGIGGFALASEWAFGEVEHVFCDNEPFAQAVLKKHWPDAKIYGDIRTLTANAEGRIKHELACELAVERIEDKEATVTCDDYFILTGGFPCQPFSQAGLRKGTDDDRYLWPEMLRVIREFNPRWVIGENVGGLVTWNDGMVLEQVCVDLEREGYEVQPFIIPAVAVNAPHRRDRVWIVANRVGNGEGSSHRSEGGISELGRKVENISQGNEVRSDIANSDLQGRTDANSANSGLEGREQEWGGYSRFIDRARSYEGRDWNKDWVEVATRLCRVDDGIPDGLDEVGGISAKPKKKKVAAGRQHRLRGLGNAIVPHIAFQLMLAIRTIEESLYEQN